MLSHETEILEQVEQGVDSIRKRDGNFGNVKEALWTWCEHVLNNKGPLHDEILVSQGMKIVKELGMPPNEFKASQGWVYNFKKQH